MPLACLRAQGHEFEVRPLHNLLHPSKTAQRPPTNSLVGRVEQFAHDDKIASATSPQPFSHRTISDSVTASGMWLSLFDSLAR